MRGAAPRSFVPGPVAITILLAFAGLGAGSRSAAAQILTGRVLEEGNTAPVEGALVVLLDADSARLRAVLSGPGGRYEVRLPDGGGYRAVFHLRVERIGYATVVTPAVGRDRAEGGTFDVALPVQAVSLEPIVATGAGRCVVDPRTAEETAMLWDQARKTLEVTALVHREGLVRFHAVHFERALAPDRSVLLGESVELGVLDRPFRSRPAAELDEAGWIQREDESNVYYMPDPEVALSDDFLDAHCFHVVVRGEGGSRQVGLAFEPLADRRLPDVAGVLWLDGRTAELRSLEYGYTGLDREEVEELAGGAAEFEQLVSGIWVVRRWHITMPVLRKRKHFLGLLTEVVVSEIREEGGEVLDARDERGRRLTRPGPWEVVGEVRDGDDGSPLNGAVVRLSGTRRVVTTGVDGSFRFRGLPRGEYLLTFRHPLQDTLGVRPDVWPVHLPGTEGLQVLKTPGRAEIRAQACPDVKPEWTSGVLTGRVVDGGTGEGLAGVRVLMRFQGPRGRAHTLDAETDDEGWYRFCAVIPDRPLTLHAEDGDRRSHEATARVPERGFVLVDLTVGAEGTAVAPSTAPASSGRSGPQPPTSRAVGNGGAG